MTHFFIKDSLFLLYIHAFVLHYIIISKMGKERQHVKQMMLEPSMTCCATGLKSDCSQLQQNCLSFVYKAQNKLT